MEKMHKVEKGPREGTCGMPLSRMRKLKDSRLGKSEGVLLQCFKFREHKMFLTARKPL